MYKCMLHHLQRRWCHVKQCKFQSAVLSIAWRAVVVKHVELLLEQELAQGMLHCNAWLLVTMYGCTLPCVVHPSLGHRM